MEYSPKKMIDKMNENNFGFKKKFGQNFIIDENIINDLMTQENSICNDVMTPAESLSADGVEDE